MKMNCLVVDDEPVARKGIAEYIAEIEFLNLVGECENPLKASAIMSEQNVDLIFLDIQMPKLSGIEFFKNIKESSSCDLYNCFFTVRVGRIFTRCGRLFNEADYI